MTRFKTFLLAGIFVVILGVSTGVGFNATQVKADTTSGEAVDITLTDAENNGEAVPYGLITNLSLSIDGEHGEVWAIVKNTFTLFPATVQVYVQLYSSDTYQDTYKNMDLICKNYTKDLNMNQTVETRTSTNGEQKYWRARMYFKIDNKDWKEKETETYLLDGDGLLVM